MSSPQREQDNPYAGGRILDAMHEAKTYSNTIYDIIGGVVPPGTRHILDFGAGDGAFAGRFANDGVGVVCLEPDARLRASLRDKGYACVAEPSELESDRFDFIYTINVFEHIPDLDGALRDVMRVLKPGGTLAVFVPAFEVLWTSLDDEVEHVQRFTKRSLGSFLERAGLAIDRIEYFDSLGFPAALTIRALETVKKFAYKPSSVRTYDRYIFPVSRKIDRFSNQLLGKNVFCVARKKA